MLLETLKLQTRPHHERLEAVVGLPRTLPDHVQTLCGFLGFFLPWEAAIRGGPNSELLAGRSRLTWLQDDLAFFGLRTSETEALPHCEMLPPLRSRPEILGSLYVLEGSTLGGQFISRHLESQLGLKEGAGYSYYRSYGPEVPRRWAAFRQELLAASSPESDPVIIGSAAATFDSLERWFGRQLAGAP